MAQALAEKFEPTGHFEKKSVASAPQRKLLAGTPQPPFHKGREIQPLVSIKRLRDGKSRTLAREMGVRAITWSKESEFHGEGRRIPGWKRRINKRNFPWGRSRKHERVSGRKSSLREFGESWFHRTSGQIWNMKGRRRARSLDDSEKSIRVIRKGDRDALK